VPYLWPDESPLPWRLHHRDRDLHNVRRRGGLRCGRKHRRGEQRNPALGITIRRWMLESRQLLIDGKVLGNMPTRRFSSSCGDVVTPKAAVSGAKDSSDPAGMKSALLVSPLLEDHRRLSQIFLDKGWTLHLTHTLEFALGLLRDRPIRVVITERDLPLGDWKDALTALQQWPHQPLSSSLPGSRTRSFGPRC
jgi:hypothetical protein